METKEQILKKYVETIFSHTKIVSEENALKAMEEYALQNNNKKPDDKIKCKHKNVRENISGGRFDECLDCGKKWG